MTEREPSSGRPRCTGCGAFLRRRHATTGMCDPCLSKHSAKEEADAAARECGWQPDKQLKTYSGEDHTVSVLRLLPRPTAHCAPKTRLPYREAVAWFQRGYIQEVLARRCGNQNEAAREMGIHRNTLSRTMTILGMR